MNAEVMQERWRQMRAEAQQRWNRLTSDDLDFVLDKKNKLVDLVEERYGYGRQRAQDEVNRFMREYGDDVRATAGPWLARTRRFVNDNPWAGIVIAVLLLGLVAGALDRRNVNRR